MAIIEDTVKDQSGQPVIVRMQVTDDSQEQVWTDDDDDDGRVTRGDSVVTARARAAFNDSLHLIHTCATQISSTIQKIPPELRPRQCEVQFAVKVDGKVGAFIAESTAGAQLQVTLKWGPNDDE